MLSVLHGKEIIHKNIDPRNVYLSKDGNCKVGFMFELFF
jgi:serine/threonine protein kinase